MVEMPHASCLAGMGHLGLACVFNYRGAFGMNTHQPWNITLRGGGGWRASLFRRYSATPTPPEQDAYHVCRQWTIAVFQHISENEFSQHLVGGSPRHLESAAYNFFYDDTNDNNTVNVHRRTHRLSVIEIIARSRHLARTIGSYDVGTNAGVDVVFSTVAIPAFYSALPATVGLRDDNYKTIHGVSGTRCFH